MNALDEVREAVTNVLHRKRQEWRILKTKYDAGCNDKGGPPKGLGSEIACLSREIRALESAMTELSQWR